MPEFNKNHTNYYIQKTSTNVPLGGIAETTHESILLCPNTTPPPHLVLSWDQKSDRRIFVECVMASFGGFVHFLGEFSKTQSLKFNTTLSRQVIRDTCFAFPQLFWYLTPASCNVWMIDWGTNELHLSLEEGLSRCVSFIFFVFCICVFVATSCIFSISVFVATFCILYLRICGNYLYFVFAYLWQLFVFFICVFVATFLCKSQTFENGFPRYFLQLFALGLISGGWLQSRLEPLPSFSAPTKDY